MLLQIDSLNAVVYCFWGDQEERSGVIESNFPAPQIEALLFLKACPSVKLKLDHDMPSPTQAFILSMSVDRVESNFLLMLDLALSKILPTPEILKLTLHLQNPSTP